MFAGPWSVEQRLREFESTGRWPAPRRDEPCRAPHGQCNTETGPFVPTGSGGECAWQVQNDDPEQELEAEQRGAPPGQAVEDEAGRGRHETSADGERPDRPKAKLFLVLLHVLRPPALSLARGRAP